MASGSSAPPHHETFAVFVNTSLDTHLAMVVSPEDTIGDLKGKIRIEHALCFPNIGEITVQSMKVRRKCFFYHLSDSMLVKSAFNGIKGGTWFLHMDAVSSCHQAGTPDNVMNQIGRQPRKHHDVEPNANNLSSGVARVQGFIVNGSSDGKDSIPSEANTVHEEQALPDASLQMLPIHDNLSLPHAGSRKTASDQFGPGDANVDASNHMNLGAKVLHDDLGTSDNAKWSERDVPELHDILGVEANDGFVSVKKKKSRRKIYVSQSDQLLEKYGSFTRKEKGKEEKDGTSEEPVKDTVANFGGCVHSKDTPALENVHPETSSQGKQERNPSSEKLCSAPQHDDTLPTILINDEKKKKKKRKRKKMESKFDETLLKNRLTNHGAGKDHPIQDQVTFAESEGPLDGKHTDLCKESDAAVIFHEAAPPRYTAYIDSEVPTNSHRNKKSKRESSRNASSKGDSLNPSRVNVNEENLEEASGKILNDPSKVTDATTAIEETVDRGNYAEGDSEVPSKTNVRSSRLSRRKKSDKSKFSSPPSNTSGAGHPSGDQVTEDNPKETSYDHHKDPHKESKEPIVLGEGAVLRNPAVEHSTVRSNTNDGNSQRRREKTTKAESPNHDSIDKEPIHSLVKEATEENPKETLEDSSKEQGKESKLATILGEVAARKCPAEANLTISSKSNHKNSRHHKKKTGNEYTFETTTDETVQNLAHGNHNHVNSTGLPNAHLEIGHKDHGNQIDVSSTGLPNDSAERRDIPHNFTEKATEKNTKGLLGKTREYSDEETIHNATNEGLAKSIETNDHMEHSKSDTENVNFTEFFVPNGGQLESLASAQEHSSLETETGKSHKKQTKSRKRKPNIHSEDSTHDLIPAPSLYEQDKLQKIPQYGDPGNPPLVDPMTQQTAKEPNAKKTHNESDVNLGDTSSDLGAIRNSLDSSRLEEKTQVYNSNTHRQVTMSKDEQNKHLKGKTSADSESKHDSIPYLEAKDSMDSVDENQLHDTLDAFVRSSTVTEPVTQNHSSTFADVSLKETMAKLAASSDSTADDSTYQKKRFRVALSKVPSNRFRQNLDNTSHDTTLGESAANGKSDEGADGASLTQSPSEVGAATERRSLRLLSRTSRAA